MVDIPKLKRGRPKGSKGKNPLLPLRTLVVLSAYNEAKELGKKSRDATKYACEQVKRKFPLEKMSMTEVNRVLAKYQPIDAEKKNADVLMVKMEENLPVAAFGAGVINPPWEPLADGSTVTRYSLKSLPRPQYKSQRKSHQIRFSKKFTKRT